MKRGLSLGLMALVMACGAPVVEDVQQKYTARVRQLGLTPVYPPREGVQVGDIFISSAVRGNDAKTVRFAVDSAPEMIGAVEAALRGRLVFTPSAGDKPTKDTVGFQPDIAGGQLQTRMEVGGAAVTLPIVVFPEVTADAGSSLNFGILAPFSARGLFGGTRTTVTLNFNDVRAYGVDPVAIPNLTAKRLCSLIKDSGLMLDGYENRGKSARAYLARTVAALEEPASVTSNRRERFTLITKVYLTRSITYTYRNTKILAAARQVLTADGKPQQMEGGGVVVNVVPISTDGQVADGTVTAGAEAAQSGTDGFSFAGFSGLGLSIDRAFAQPVAIAYEGVSFDPEADDATRQLCQDALKGKEGAVPGAGTNPDSASPAAVAVPLVVEIPQ